MKEVKLEIHQILKCPECGERVEECESCGDYLTIEMGSEFDCYCDGLDHYCVFCGKIVKGD